MSVMSDEVRQEISIQKALPTPQCHCCHSYLDNRHIAVWTTISRGQIFVGMEAFVKIKVVILSRLSAHHTQLYVSLC